MQIIPAILTDDIQEYKDEVEGVVRDGKYERIQVDFVEKQFDNKTIRVIDTYPAELKPLTCDAHLMTDSRDIETDVAEARMVGYKRIIAQVELLESQTEFLAWTDGYDRGLAVDLDTGVEQIDDEVLSQLDVVLLMAVEAGFGGQVFDNRVLGKIKELADIRKNMNLKFRICVDGGVEKLHLAMLEELGVDEVAVGVKRMLGW
jgi:ribulose-phosphate 3-epimerase